MAGKPGQKRAEQNEHHNTELGQAIVCAIHGPPRSKKFELTGVGHLRRPKNAMDEGEDVLFCFYVGWRCGDNWLVCFRVWEFREPNAESGVAGPPWCLT